jgi:DNA (cytosine-5)-methyltransferase 1
MIDLFAGAGGLSLGLEDAGFEPVAANEWNRDACDTYAKHHPLVDLVSGDIAKVSWRPWRGHVGLVAGGPPCQPWSSGGKRLGEQDERNGFPQFLRVLREVQPPAFLIENVAGLVKADKLAYFHGLLKGLEELDYKLAYRVLNAADYGVPQKRHRLFIVGTRDRQFVFPEPTHGPGRRWRWQPAGKILRRTKSVGEPNDAIVTYAKSPDLRPDPYDGHVYNGGGRPIDLSRPSPTLLASMGGNKTPWVDTRGVVAEYHAYLVAGGEPRSGEVPGARRITVAEAALLQTFPVPEIHGSEGIAFAGRRSSQYVQVGNAVPPRLARAVGRALLVQLSSG